MLRWFVMSHSVATIGQLRPTNLFSRQWLSPNHLVLANPIMRVAGQCAAAERRAKRDRLAVESQRPLCVTGFDRWSRHSRVGAYVLIPSTSYPGVKAIP